MDDKYKFVEKGLIPLDKSWMIRMGLLDSINGKDDIIRFMEEWQDQGEDLQALYRVTRGWNSGKALDVGESGTVNRFFQFASWKLGLHKEFLKRGTLLKRPICDNPEIVNWPLERLASGELDKGTSQWASAAVLLGNTDVLGKSAAFKLKLSYEALKYWKERREEGKVWEARYDETFLKQANAFTDLFLTRKADWVAEQSEDYCFGRVFGWTSREYAEKHWPNLQGNETKRLDEVDNQIERYEKGLEITAPDHRIVQALAMKAKVDGKPVNFKHPDSVKKTWPRFWEFLDYAISLRK